MNRLRSGIAIGNLEAVLRGPVQPFPRPDGSPGERSAIAKISTRDSIFVHPLGLEGDEQGNLRVHGGPDKAVHHYALEHYALWRAELGALSVLDQPGAFGENLASRGVTETTICWGDRLRIGNTLLEVSQSRQPCWKLNVRFGHRDMAKRVQDTGRTGWYYRVLEPGTITVGDTIWLLERPHPEWPLARVIDVLYRTMLDIDLLLALSRLHLPPSWERLVRRRLESGTVEDWQSRIQG